MPKLVSWQDRSYFSVSHDSEICKISAFDENNQEYWSIIETGKGFRDRREAALFAIMEHIEAGGKAGEV